MRWRLQLCWQQQRRQTGLQPPSPHLRRLRRGLYHSHLHRYHKTIKSAAVCHATMLRTHRASIAQPRCIMDSKAVWQSAVACRLQHLLLSRYAQHHAGNVASNADADCFTNTTRLSGQRQQQQEQQHGLVSQCRGQPSDAAGTSHHKTCTSRFRRHTPSTSSPSLNLRLLWHHRTPRRRRHRQCRRCRLRCRQLPLHRKPSSPSHPYKPLIRQGT